MRATSIVCKKLEDGTVGKPVVEIEHANNIIVNADLRTQHGGCDVTYEELCISHSHIISRDLVLELVRSCSECAIRRQICKTTAVAKLYKYIDAINLYNMDLTDYQAHRLNTPEMVVGVSRIIERSSNCCIIYFVKLPRHSFCKAIMELIVPHTRQYMDRTPESIEYFRSILRKISQIGNNGISKNEISNNSQSEAILARHIEIRKEVFNKKQKRTIEYNLGDLIGVSINPFDRNKTDEPCYLPCKVRLYSPASKKYKVQCQYHMIYNSYSSTGLSDFRGMNFPQLNLVDITSPCNGIMLCSALKILRGDSGVIFKAVFILIWVGLGANECSDSSRVQIRH
ncbi:hypothetical protein BDA99DRAFT_539981 [Phascolomyces articulosus]|uniref:Uncharacterized protein n=1 Tax=Phascolomyces articulosus TaxID=60185 RepID=A0AAD5PB53_9FUNG|nr:hypothetical protein BDA99DRAFT_539981 [Phascolomyces articulosus]